MNRRLVIALATLLVPGCGGDEGSYEEEVIVEQPADTTATPTTEVIVDELPSESIPSVQTP